MPINSRRMAATVATAEPSLLEQILLGEAASEGEDGLRMVAEVLANRARRRRSTLEAEATRPYQFSAYQRPDLARFAGQQPREVQELARRVLAEVQAEGYVPRYAAPDGHEPPDHYLTTALYRSPKAPRWVQGMTPVGEVGAHTLLSRRRGQ